MSQAMMDGAEPLIVPDPRIFIQADCETAQTVRSFLAVRAGSAFEEGETVSIRSIEAPSPEQAKLIDLVMRMMKMPEDELESHSIHIVKTLNYFISEKKAEQDFLTPPNAMDLNKLQSALACSIIEDGYLAPFETEEQSESPDVDRVLRAFIVALAQHFSSLPAKLTFAHLQEKFGLPKSVQSLGGGADRKKRRSTLLYRSFVATNTRQAPIGHARLLQLLSDCAFFVPEGENSVADFVHRKSEELCEIVSRHQIHSYVVTQMLVELANWWLLPPGKKPSLPAAEGAPVLLPICLSQSPLPVLRRVLEGSHFCEDFATFRPALATALSMRYHLLLGASSPAEALTTVRLLICTLARLQIISPSLALLLHASAAASSWTAEEAKSFADGASSFVSALPPLHPALEKYTSAMAQYVQGATADTYSAVASLTLFGAASRGVKKTNGSAQKIVTMRYKAREPSWKEILTSTVDASLFAPVNFLCDMVQIGAWEEMTAMLRSSLKQNVNFFILPTERFLRSLKLKILAAAETPSAVPPASSVPGPSSSSQGRAAHYSTVIQAVMRTLLAVLGHRYASEVAALETWRRFFPLLEVAQSYLAAPSFLSQVMRFLIHKIEQQTMREEWSHEAGRFLSCVLLPCQRVLSPVPAMCIQLDDFLKILPVTMRASACLASSRKMYPHDELACIERKALMSYCLTRVTNEDAAHYALVLRPVAICDPLALSEKLAKQAVGYCDPLMLRLFAQLLREAPAFSIKAFEYVCIRTALAFAEEEREGSVARVTSITTLLVMTWRQHLEQFDGEYFLTSLMTALHREARSSVVFATCLLKSLFAHFLHRSLDHEEHWNTLQLKALCARPISKFYGSGMAESLLAVWTPSFTLVSLESNFRHLAELLSSFANPLASGSAPNSWEEYPIGARLLLQLCWFHRRLDRIYKDLSGTVEQVLLLTFTHIDCLNDLVQQLAPIVLAPDGPIVSNPDSAAKYFAELTRHAVSPLVLKLATFLWPRGTAKPSPDLEKFVLENVALTPPRGEGDAAPSFCGIPVALYMSFWGCRPEDVVPMPKEAEKEIEARHAQVVAFTEKNPEGKSWCRAKLAARLEEHKSLLEVERQAHVDAVAETERELLAGLDAMFQTDPKIDCVLFAESFVHHCLLPRCLLSHDDAITSLQFLRAVVSLSRTGKLRPDKEASSPTPTSASPADMQFPSFASAQSPLYPPATTTVPHSDIRRKVSDIIKVFVTAVCSMFVSFTIGEVKRLGVAMHDALELAWETAGRGGKPSCFEFLCITTLSEPLLTEIYITEALAQLLREREAVPMFVHRNGFGLLEILRGAFPKTKASAEVLADAAAVHAVRSSPLFQSATSCIKNLQSVAGNPLFEPSEREEVQLRRKLQCEVAANAAMQEQIQRADTPAPQETEPVGEAPIPVEAEDDDALIICEDDLVGIAGGEREELPSASAPAASGIDSMLPEREEEDSVTIDEEAGRRAEKREREASMHSDRADDDDALEPPSKRLHVERQSDALSETDPNVGPEDRSVERPQDMDEDIRDIQGDADEVPHGQEASQHPDEVRHPDKDAVAPSLCEAVHDEQLHAQDVAPLDADEVPRQEPTPDPSAQEGPMDDANVAREACHEPKTSDDPAPFAKPTDEEQCPGQPKGQENSTDAASC